MSLDITMPALSPTMEKGNLARWTVKVGDHIKPGDIIAEIETDKATMEVEAAEEGMVSHILVPAGSEDVPVGQVIARLGGEEEAAAAPEPEPEPEPIRPEVKADGSAKSSPLARRIAQAKGIDLSTVRGSGSNGRIVSADLLPPPAQAPLEAPPPALAYGPPEGVPYEAVKVSAMRRTIAHRLSESKRTVPHFYMSVDVRLEALLQLRGEINTSLGIRLSVNDMIIKAMAVALREVPDANVQFAGDQLFKFSRADISVAVAIPGGLITPVVRDADGKRLSAIAAEMKDLAARARDGKLAPDEYQGGTASLSNLGMYGMRQFDAIINPPQAVILGVGAGEKRPWVAGDALVVATVLTATGSFDHRAVDGATAAEFMAAFKRLVENPLAML